MRDTPSQTLVACLDWYAKPVEVSALRPVGWMAGVGVGENWRAQVFVLASAKWCLTLRLRMRVAVPLQEERGVDGLITFRQNERPEWGRRRYKNVLHFGSLCVHVGVSRSGRGFHHIAGQTASCREFNSPIQSNPTS